MRHPMVKSADDLTEETALEISIASWGDLTELGGNEDDKEDWMSKHGYKYYKCDCALCEYFGHARCTDCPLAKVGAPCLENGSVYSQWADFVEDYDKEAENDINEAKRLAGQVLAKLVHAREILNGGKKTPKTKEKWVDVTGECAIKLSGREDDVRWVCVRHQDHLILMLGDKGYVNDCKPDDYKVKFEEDGLYTNGFTIYKKN